MTPWRPSATRPSPPASPWMRGLYSGFDAARASWEFPEGTCAGFLGYPSDPANDGLESTAETGAADQDLLDNDGDTAVKVSREKINCANLKNICCPRFASPRLAWAGSAPTGTRCCGRTASTWAWRAASWRTAASAPSSRSSSTRRRSSGSPAWWRASISKWSP